MKKQNIALWIVGSIILTAISFVVIPKLIKKYGDKVYKSSLQNEEIDFDEMGPEIVKKNTEEK